MDDATRLVLAAAGGDQIALHRFIRSRVARARDDLVAALGHAASG